MGSKLKTAINIDGYCLNRYNWPVGYVRYYYVRPVT